jgi:pimeloyl-ACP methyl ester carboxylesterase
VDWSVPWYAFGLTEDNARSPLALTSFEEQPSLSAFRAALDGFDTYFPESDGPVPGVDAIASWAESAVDSAAQEGGDGIATWGEDGLVLVEDGRPQVVFWHHSSSVALDVPAGRFTAVELEYHASDYDDYRQNDELRKLLWRGQGEAAWEESVLLELNGVVGAESIRFRDVVAAPRRLGEKAVRVTLHLAEQPLKLAGSAVGTVGAAMYTEEDRSAPGRLAHEEWQSRAVAPAFPRLDDNVVVADTGPIGVIVHGFGSCAMPAARALSQRESYSLPTYRFEHDTFLDPRDNARDLAGLLRKKANGRAVLFICHSRGGLVARYAASSLTDRITKILTLGTPHAGTPIAATWGTGARLGFELKNLYYGETVSTGGTPHPGSVAHGYATRRFPPPGLSVLRPDGAFFRNLAEDAPPGDTLTAYGGHFRAADSAKGPLSTTAGWLKAKFADGLFDGQRNDLVVSVESATAVASGHGHVLKESCAHSDFYANLEALAAIDAAAKSLSQKPKHPYKRGPKEDIPVPPQSKLRRSP